MDSPNLISTAQQAVLKNPETSHGGVRMLSLKALGKKIVERGVLGDRNVSRKFLTPSVRILTYLFNAMMSNDVFG